MIVRNNNFLFSPVNSLNGIGEKIASALARLDIYNIKDLILYKPIDVQYKVPLEKGMEIINNTTYIATIKITNIPNIRHHNIKSKVPLVIEGEVFSRNIRITFFNYIPYHIINKISVGESYIFVGKMGQFKNALTIINPDFYQIDQADIISHIEPRYPLTYGINSKIINNFVDRALLHFDEIDEWLPSRIIKRYNFPNFLDALKNLHYFNRVSQEEYSLSLKRLSFDELFAHNLILKLSKRNDNINHSNITRKINTGIVDKIIETLPYNLTDSQKKVISEIIHDMEKPNPMFRIVQGDVGSGKTIISIISMAASICDNSQAVIMVPTDILAKQHYHIIDKILSPLGFKVGILKNAMKPSLKRENIAKIESGELNIIIGTHSLIQEKVNFANLRFAVIDEQHRFGVKQRLALAEKGEMVDILLMTATPIPRTLLLAHHGEIDVSINGDKPDGRVPIITNCIGENKLQELANSLEKFLQKKQKIYWICPFIEESDQIENVTSVITRYEYLKKIYGSKVALLHGQMKNEEKNEIMEKFAFSDEVSILVATTVIEVGVDVPSATCIVIENAEKFGLSQLHQLRGRVGRNSLASYCILLHSDSLSLTAKKRLKAMKESNDGFYLSERDLELRGGGEILGTRQSGITLFKFAEFPRDDDILQVILEETELLFETMSMDNLLDNEFASEKVSAIQLLLKIFEYEGCLNLLKS